MRYRESEESHYLFLTIISFFSFGFPFAANVCKAKLNFGKQRGKYLRINVKLHVYLSRKANVSISRPFDDAIFK